MSQAAVPLNFVWFKSAGHDDFFRLLYDPCKKPKLILLLKYRSVHIKLPVWYVGWVWYFVLFL